MEIDIQKARVQMTRGFSFACAIRLTPHGAFPHLPLLELFTPPLPTRVRCVPRDTTSIQLQTIP